MAKKTCWNTQKIVTTKEQSAQLLALGLPADSADCYYNVNPKKWGVPRDTETPLIIPMTMHLGWGNPDYIPCWSSARLVTIFKICFIPNHGIDDLDSAEQQLENINWDDVVGWLVDAISHFVNRGMFDFSKLEE